MLARLRRRALDGDGSPVRAKGDNRQGQGDSQAAGWASEGVYQGRAPRPEKGCPVRRWMALAAPEQP